jgi:hypothetical protein
MPSLNLVHTDLPLLRDPQRQAKAVAAIRRLAMKMATDQPPAESVRALLLAMHDDRPDHIALAIGAHQLLAPAVVEDIQNIGQPKPPQAELLTALCGYLDHEGWNIGAEGRFYPSFDPRRLG